MPRRSATEIPAVPHSTPAETRIYAVGDIHGRADLLSETMERIDADLWRRPVPQAVEIYLGDYVDRGPDSKEVIELLATRLVRNNAVCLRGNHEDMMEHYLRDPSILSSWLQLGGMQTLASYGVHLHHDGKPSTHDLHQSFCRAFPRTHALFLKCLKPWICCGDYLFVHAGIRPNVALDQQRIDDLLWIREEFLESPHRHTKFVVHGHTPVAHPDLRHNRLNIDTAAWHSGTLTCVILEDASIQFL